MDTEGAALMTDKSTQSEAVLSALHDGPLTPLDALQRYGIFRLGARIWELKQAGYSIETEMVTVKTRNGSARVASYSLAAPRLPFGGTQ